MNFTYGSTSRIKSTDLSICSTDSGESLEKVGAPHAWPLARISSPGTLLNKRNRKSWTTTSRTRRTLKTTKSKAFPGVCGHNITKKRVTNNSCMIPTNKPARKAPQIRQTKHLKTRLRKSIKEKATRFTSKSQGNMRKNSKTSIHCEERFITKRLATSQHCTHLRFASSTIKPMEGGTKGKTRVQSD